jgi:hypothetical protein
MKRKYPNLVLSSTKIFTLRATPDLWYHAEMDFQLTSREWHYALPDAKARITILHTREDEGFHVARETWDEDQAAYVHMGLTFHFVGEDAYDRAFNTARLLWQRAVAAKETTG